MDCDCETCTNGRYCDGKDEYQKAFFFSMLTGKRLSCSHYCPAYFQRLQAVA